MNEGKGRRVYRSVKGLQMKQRRERRGGGVDGRKEVG